MQKRFLVLTLFIVLSVALFFAWKMLLVYLFVPDNVALAAEFAQAAALVPYFFGSFALILLALSWTGRLISSRKGKGELYIGFTYSLAFSLFVMVAAIVLIVYYLMPQN